MTTNKLLLFFILLFSPLITHAQIDACAARLPITLTVSSELSSTVPSASIGFYTEMQNTSADLISDATLAVEVVQKDTGTIVSRFVVLQPVTVFPNSSGKVGFVWKVPLNVNSGEYTVMVTFVPMGGSRAEAFAHVYPTASRDVTISNGGAMPASVRALTVNGNIYTPDTVARVAKEGHVSAIAAASNDIQGPYKGAVVWRLYAPDATLSDQPIDTHEQSVGLHPQQSANIQYDLPALTLDSYYLEGELSDGHSTSYFDILLAREDGAFAWTKCLTTSTTPKNGSGNVIVVVSLIAAVIVIGVLWEIAQRRRA
ncbi:hypothetical protein HY971_03230 [Candidatus Kaiserbacteria bacterium]|nr:hypothetical protein [Candidatus Kaiserbacteria bacterium]